MKEEEKTLIVKPECQCKGKAVSFLIGLLVGAVITVIAFVAFMLASGRPNQPQMPQMQGGNAPQMQQQMPGQGQNQGRQPRGERPPKGIDKDLESEEDED